MSQEPSETAAESRRIPQSPLAEWLRGCLKEHRRFSLMASCAAAAVTVAAWSPLNEWISAATFYQDESGHFIVPAATFPNASQGDSFAVDQFTSIHSQNADSQGARSQGADDGMQIVPRGKDASTPTIPFRPAIQMTPPSTFRPQVSNAIAPRGTLQRPVFGQLPSNNSDSVPPAAVTADSNDGPPRSQPGRSGERPSSGLNFVDAAGLESLPYAGQRTAAKKTSSAVVSRSQDGVAAGPGTPVPAVPRDPATSKPLHIFPSDAAHRGPGGNSAASESAEVGVVGQGLGSGSSPAAANVDVPDGPVQSASPRGAALQDSSGGRSVRGPAPGTSGFRATVESDAPGWIGPYMGRTEQLPAGAEVSPAPIPSVQLPHDFSAWWDAPVQQRAGIAPRALPVDVTSLVQQALVYSSQVQVLQAEPEVQQRIVRQEESAFDWRAFLDSKYDDLNDPIGNTLTTGNNDERFNDRHLTSSGGLKKRTSAGGEVKLAQQFGYQDNNSRFLLPNPQSTSRLELSFRQPLMSRSGVVYNQNQIVLARISANAAGDETLDELQKHLYSVTDAYWKLYRARAEFFQRQKLLSSSRYVLQTLEGRNEVDTIPRQILRARAAVARAESRMQRAVTDIRNAESQLRLLVNDPDMLDGGPVEFTPSELPSMSPLPVSLRESLQTALMNRPDISNAIRQMRASGVRMGVSRNEMLPKLDFIVSSYVAGLENKAQFADSFTNQFTEGRPGYTVGLEFEIPLGNRGGKARLEQRQWELKRAINSFRATVETSLTEVEISSREVETAWRELLGKYQAMIAAQNEVSYLQDRFEVLPMVEESSMLLLEDLLDGYERLADEEAAFAQAQTNYALSIIQLRRATGTMLRSRHDAPELEPVESEWMEARAEQAANEMDTRVAGDVVVPGADLNPIRNVSGTVVSPSTWSDNLVTRPRSDERSRSDAAVKSNTPSPSTRTESRPTPPPRPRVGGHSFGGEF